MIKTMIIVDGNRVEYGMEMPGEILRGDDIDTGKTRYHITSREWKLVNVGASDWPETEWQLHLIAEKY